MLLEDRGLILFASMDHEHNASLDSWNTSRVYTRSIMPAWVGKARKGSGFGDSKCHQASQPGGLWISEKYTKTVNWKRNPMYLRSEKVNQQWSDHQRAEATLEKSAWVHYGIKILKVKLSYLQLRRQASPSTQHRQLERHWLRVTATPGIRESSLTWKPCLKVPQTVLPLVAQDSCFLGSPPAIVIQSLSSVWQFVTPWTAAHQASPSFTILRSLLKLMFIELVMPSNHLILPPPSPLALNFSQHQGLFLLQ